ncbi:NAD(P)-dependent dehydrogenase (short-subunit alcohol dehydrogenase family) [Variovorax paradoxus]|uniref:SDR family NAD(P)-dependent oxidoreductase n=1 Tax=Variovorax paradoxus TaxID=34073 RepID=UPI0027841D97|nr:SDR family NAD(P)-dependent oxidoreductase [Variovorax paradoxus]MDP9962959.1 NAD(P)-dependent dehydrogenase (short-subunit alcohol dehydrogenase family) [Variovorax paradoxus]
MKFSRKIVMVTGAAGNLARAVVRAFAEQGALLILIDRTTVDPPPGVVDEGRSLHIEADLLKQDDVDRAVRSGLQHFGRIDVLCNLAGGFRMGEAVHETSLSTWDLLFDLNARSVVHVAKAVVPAMLAQGGGKIVNVGAFAAQKGVAQMGAYTASKAAVVRLTESMALELRERGINVNCVLPTIIDTPENRLAMPDADPARWVAPGDLAAAILFLASDDARSIHGVALPVTGLS